jgi:hypothetical protein
MVFFGRDVLDCESVLARLKAKRANSVKKCAAGLPETSLCEVIGDEGGCEVLGGGLGCVGRWGVETLCFCDQKHRVRRVSQSVDASFSYYVQQTTKKWISILQ